MPDYGTFGVGKIVYPLAGYASNSALQIADKPIYWLLDYCAAALNSYAGDAWTHYANQVGLKDQNGSALTSIVREKLPYNPIPFLQDSTFNFPLLALYRTKGSVTEKTIAFHRIESTLDLLWIMPPLSAAQAESLLPFQNAVLDILVDRNEQGWDPYYLDGYHVGAAAGFDSLQVIDYQLANISSNPNEMLPTVQMTVKMRERKMPVAGAFVPFDGIDTEMDLKTTLDGYETYPHFDDFKNDF